jgi:hypothetical protein
MIADKVSEGLPLKDAAALCGVSNSAVHRWKQQGEEATKGKFRDFVDKLQVATSQRKELFTKSMASAALGEWAVEIHEKKDDSGKVVSTETVRKFKKDTSLARWLMQRWYPEDYGEQVTINGPAPVETIVICEFSPEREKEIAEMNNNILPAPDEDE